MNLLYRSARTGKILITSRYRVPNADDWLATEEPGPLSAAQTGKLMLNLSALAAQDTGGLMAPFVLGKQPMKNMASEIGSWPYVTANENDSREQSSTNRGRKYDQLVFDTDVLLEEANQ